MISATWAVYVDWNNDGDWGDSGEDISAYVREMSWSYGRDYASELRGRSTSGSCNIVLINTDGRFSSFNPGSPYYGNILPGRKIKITSTYGGITVTQWIGYLQSIDPQPSIDGLHLATLTGIGPLGHLADRRLTVSMQTDVATGTAINTILTALGLGAGDYVLDTGQTTMARWWTDSDADALSALREIEETETGFLRETKDGKIQFEDRIHRASTPHTTSQATWSDAAGAAIGFQAIDQNDYLESILNDFEAEITPHNLAEEKVLWIAIDMATQRGGRAPSIAGSGGTLTLVAVYYPPTLTGRPAANPGGVSAWTTPVANTDYKANTAAAGSGTDITSDISIVVTKSADRMEMVITNNNASTAYLMLLQARGIPVVEDHTTIVKDEDSTSIAKYGRRPYRYTAKFLADIAEVQAFLGHLKASYKDPHPVITLSMLANASADSMTEALTRDVSDCITIDADGAANLGINDDFFVERIAHRIASTGEHTFEIQCGDVSMDYWAESAHVYAPKTLHDLAPPDDLRGYAIANGTTITTGIVAWKWSASIYEGEFRAKRMPAGTTDETVDLRTVAEGGTFVAGADGIIETGLTSILEIVAKDTLGLSGRGFNRQWTSAAAGRWYYAGRLQNVKGWSVWSDGNAVPQFVTDFIDTNDLADGGPPADWTVRGEAGIGNTVIAKATRPQTNGNQIWFAAAQAKLVSEVSGITYLGIGGLPSSQPRFKGQSFTDAGWREVDANDGAAITIYDGSAIAHTYDKDAGTITKASGTYGSAGEGDLLIMDVRSGDFDIAWCQWGLIGKDAISGVTISGMGGFRLFTGASASDVRVKIVKAPWLWDTEGYLGGYAGGGIASMSFWEVGADTTTKEFVFPPIELPPGATLDQIALRVWFENGVSRNDDSTYSTEAPIVISESFRLTSDGGVNLGIPITPPADADLLSRSDLGSLSFYLDEGSNKLMVRVKYSNGITVKGGEVTLT